MRSVFVLVFAASGAAALIYEVTWTRLLTLQLGHGIAAASTVLAAFMGGLAVGSAAGGRWGTRMDGVTALRVYAGLELTIAALALILPFELAALEPLLATAYADGAGGAAFGVLRLLTSLVLLSVPAAAMGATFPIAARWFVHSAGVAARQAGSLYAANTIGAAFGALTAGFVLLPFLGLLGATWVAVGLNAAAAAGAFLIARRVASGPGGEARPAVFRPVDELEVVPSKVEGRRAQGRAGHGRGGSEASPAGREAPRRARRGARSPSTVRNARVAVAPQIVFASAALGISGFASLSLQVVWTRLLALILGPTTYAFSIIVSVFIAGLAVGAAIASRLAPRVRQPLVALSVCLGLSVGLGAASASLIDRGLLSIADVVAQPDVTFRDVLTRQALLAFALLAPMTIAFGAAFPFAVSAATRRDETISADLGLIYAVNTAGAIAGALLAGFALIPALGLHGTLRVVTVIGAAGALVVLVGGRTTGQARLAAGALSVAVLGLGVLLPQWDRLLLSSGAYKYAGALQGPDPRTALTAGELLYYREGASGTVAVRQTGGTTSLAIDGKVDASNAGDMLTQRLLAHVPLLLHPDPKRVAILGLGSGVTLGSALTHPIDHADVLEISPQVVDASRFFDKENHRALDDPRTRLILGDGRTHLVFTREQYDVIVSEPSNPWMAGIASLFTREFFEAAKARLTPGGVLCQWAHTYDISTRDLRSIVATFVSVFPEGTLWLVGDGDVLLIGSNTPLAPRLADIATAWQRPGVGEDLASVGARVPHHILSMFVAHGEKLAEWSAGAPVQSDNRAALEFSGPQSVFARTDSDNAALLRQLAADETARPAVIRAAEAAATADTYRDRGWMLLEADAFRPAYDDFVRAVEMNPTDARALDGLVRASAPLQRTSDTRALLSRLAADPARLTTKLALSRLLASEGAYDQAVAIPFSIVQADPSNAAALEQLASILSDVGDIERMRPVVARLRAVAPSSEAAHYYSAALLFMEERVEPALAEARRVVAINPAHARAQNLLGACLASIGRRDEARTAFQASLKTDAKDPATYANLAMLETQAGNRELAVRYFAEALTLDPSHEASRQGLAALQSASR
ncbi:MAG TPA: fused MFS/spermidine synthase [Vicinamibacterales bacterium]|nr:fused MFS/spermidine synthase [Vicinamibacterales bacterium]